MSHWNALFPKLSYLVWGRLHDVLLNAQPICPYESTCRISFIVPTHGSIPQYCSEFRRSSILTPPVNAALWRQASFWWLRWQNHLSMRNLGLTPELEDPGKRVTSTSEHARTKSRWSRSLVGYSLWDSQRSWTQLVANTEDMKPPLFSEISFFLF